MRHLVSLLTAIALLGLFGSPGLAAERKKPVTPGTHWEPGHRDSWEPARTPPPGLKDHWDIAPETFWFFYEEPSLAVEWEGWMYGIRTSYTQHSPKNHLMGSLEGRYAVGGVDYDGFLSNGTPHTDSGTDHFFEIRGKGGYDWAAGKIVTTPFLGIGFRYWLDDLESANAYERNIRYLYSPIGVAMTYAVSDRWTWGMELEYDFFWRGWVTSHLSDVNASFNDPKNRQKNGYGVRGSLSVERLVNKGLSVSVKPFIRYWRIDDSDTSAVTFAGTLIGAGQEPANKTIESGLEITFAY